VSKREKLGYDLGLKDQREVGVLEEVESGSGGENAVLSL
jgi:hypothetical protein